MMECEICALPTKGFHYHVRSCRACAAFFRRTVKLQLKYKCFRFGTCNVERENRYSCRHCRMRKCIAKGMTYEDEGESPPADMFLDSSLEQEPQTSDDFFSIRNAQLLKDQFIVVFKQKLYEIVSQPYEKPKLPYDLTLSQQISVAYDKLKRKWPTPRKDQITNGAIHFDKLIMNFYEHMQDAALFVMSIEHFPGLPPDQKRLLFRRFALKLFRLHIVFNTLDVFGNDVNIHYHVTLNGEIFDVKYFEFEFFFESRFRREALESMTRTTEAEILRTLMVPFLRFDADHFERMFLIGISLWSYSRIDGITKETADLCERMRESLAEELFSYYKFKQNRTNYADRIYKLFNLVCGIDRVGELMEESGVMAFALDLFTVRDEDDSE